MLFSHLFLFEGDRVMSNWLNGGLTIALPMAKRSHSYKYLESLFGLGYGFLWFLFHGWIMCEILLRNILEEINNPDLMAV